MRIYLRFLILMFLTATCWATSSDDLPVKHQGIQVELYMSSTCPHCHKADEFFKSLEKKTPWLQVQRHVINQDKEALISFQQKLRQFGSQDYGVPAIFFCGAKWTGFDSVETTGKKLWKGLTYCHEQIISEGKLSPVTVNVLKRMAPSPFQLANTETPSVVLTTLSTAILDAFNPCSIFAISLFLGFLFILPSRREKVIAGFFMIPALALLHYLQQAQGSSYYLLLYWLRWPTLLIGLVLIAFSLSYKRIKRASFTYSLAVLSLVPVYVYQQTCIFNNFSLFYQQLLINPAFTNGHNWLYQMLYQLFYIIPLILCWVFVLYFFSGKRAEGKQSRLEAIATLYLLTIGIILLIYPWALSNFFLSATIILPLTIAGWLIGVFKR